MVLMLAVLARRRSKDPIDPRRACSRKRDLTWLLGLAANPSGRSPLTSLPSGDGVSFAGWWLSTTATQQVCHASRVVTKWLSEVGCPRRQGSGERRPNSADALSCFVDLATGEGLTSDEVDHKPIDDRADGLHQVERQRSPIALVAVEDPECGIETVGVERDGGFGLQDCVRVIEDGVEGSGGFADSFCASYPPVSPSIVSLVDLTKKP